MNKHWITLSALLLIVSACDSTTTNASAHTGLKAEPASVASSAAAKNVVLTDISGHWGETSIQRAVKKGYVDGYEDATFRAEKEVSRAEFIKMVLTAMGPDTAAAAKPAADVKQAGPEKELTVSAGEPANWYDSYVQKAQELGIQRKEDFKEGDMNTSMTRLEMARIAVRATDPTLQKPEVRIDDRSVMYNATKKGLIQGLEAGDLAPDNTTTRAQSVTIIERILTVNSGGTLEVDKYALGNAELALKKTNIFTVMPELFSGTGRQWNMDNLTIETKDGLYKGVVTRVVAVDLEDPNDPNRGILGDLNELVWRGSGRDYFNVTDYPESYLFVVVTHTEFHKDDSETYYDKVNNGLAFSLKGVLSPDDRILREGTLNTYASVHNKNDKQNSLNAIILPKHGLQTDGHIALRLYVISHPSAGQNYKDVFVLTAPTVIE